MKRKTSVFIIVALILSLALSGCTAATPDTNLEEELEAKNSVITALEEEKKALEAKIAELEEVEPVPASQDSLISTALEVVQVIKDEDMVALSTYIHPTQGVRFSPYGYIDVPTNQVFTIAQVPGLMTNPQILTWGSYDGTGDPIDLSFADYFEEFVYDEDYVNPHMIGNNVLIGTGNTLNNIANVYPNGEFIEFHFTGFDPQYEGIDWSSLKLVFEEDNGTWYLIGIIHDQWTI